MVYKLFPVTKMQGEKLRFLDNMIQKGTEEIMRKYPRPAFGDENYRREKNELVDSYIDRRTKMLSDLTSRTLSGKIPASQKEPFKAGTVISQSQINRQKNFNLEPKVQEAPRFRLKR